MNRRELLKVFGGASTVAVVPEIKRLDVKPGDIFVLEYPESVRLSCEQIERIKQQWKEHFSHLNAGQILILDHGAKLSKISHA